MRKQCQIDKNEKEGNYGVLNNQPLVLENQPINLTHINPSAPCETGACPVESTCLHQLGFHRAHWKHYSCDLFLLQPLSGLKMVIFCIVCYCHKKKFKEFLQVCFIETTVRPSGEIFHAHYNKESSPNILFNCSFCCTEKRPLGH